MCKRDGRVFGTRDGMIASQAFTLEVSRIVRGMPVGNLQRSGKIFPHDGQADATITGTLTVSKQVPPL
jgi:hypothetical protein